MVCEVLRHYPVASPSEAVQVMLLSKAIMHFVLHDRIYEDMWKSIFEMYWKSPIPEEIILSLNLRNPHYSLLRVCICAVFDVVLNLLFKSRRLRVGNT